MTQLELSKAQNPDLRASFAAMQRAAELARWIALQTNTALVVVRHGKLLRISAAELRAQDGLLVRTRADAPPAGKDETFTRGTR